MLYTLVTDCLVSTMFVLQDYLKLAERNMQNEIPSRSHTDWLADRISMGQKRRRKDCLPPFLPLFLHLCPAVSFLGHLKPETALVREVLSGLGRGRLWCLNNQPEGGRQRFAQGRYEKCINGNPNPPPCSCNVVIAAKDVAGCTTCEIHDIHARQFLHLGMYGVAHHEI